MSDALKSGERIVDSAIRLLPNVVLGTLVFIIFLVLGALTKWLIRRAAERRNIGRAGLALLLGRLAQLGMIVLGVLIALAIVAPSFNAGSIIKMLGIGTVAIGFAFQNILQNFLAGILLLIDQPFHLGDLIGVTGIEGTVDDIEARATIVTTKEGRKVVIPNATVFMNPVSVERRSAVDQRTAGKRNASQGDPTAAENAGSAARQNNQEKDEKSEKREQVEVQAGHGARSPRFFRW
jgi:small conductance mechanosensitive channel